MEFPGTTPGIKVVEGEDTARSAEIIQQEHLKGHAAICSKAAAERYGNEGPAGRYRNQQT